VTNDALAEQFPEWTPARIHEIVGVDERHVAGADEDRGYGEDGESHVVSSPPEDVSCARAGLLTPGSSYLRPLPVSRGFLPRSSQLQ